MAVNLNPGADQTLVAAATKAAMANVPKDLSGTFESMASEYGKTMRAVGESFGSLAKTLGEVGGQLVGKAIKEIRTEDENMSVLIEKPIETTKTDAEIEAYKKENKSDFVDGEVKEDSLTSEVDVVGKNTQTTSLGQELRDIRKELSSLFLKTDPDSRKRKAELRAKKDSYYSEIALLKQENDANNQLLANENVNLEATGSLNLALNLAIKDYKTKSGKIKEGPYKGYSAALSRNEDGDLSWTLKDPSGKHVTGRDPQGNLITTGNKPYKVPLSEMSKTLTPKMDQKTVDGANKIINSAFTSGKQGVDYMGNQLVNKFRTLLDNETSLQQLADVRLGDDTKTLREHVNSESEHSAEIFAGLSSVDLASMGVDEMADGKAGYTEADFVGSAVAVENFEKVRSATFDKDNDNYDNGSHLKKLTEKHIYRTGEIMYSVGNKLYTPPKGTTTTTVPGKSYIDAAKSYVSYEDQDKKVDQAKAGKTLYDWAGIKYETTDGGKTYTIEEGYRKNQPDYVGISTTDLLSGTRFGLSNRLSGITFGGVDDGGSGGENPFGETQANRAPADFVTAVGKDDIDVVAYLEGMGITVTNKLGDKVEVEINGKTKTFTVDPNIATDENRANEMWKWMFENWNTKQEFKVGEVYERGGKNYMYNEDGTFTEK